VRLTKPGALIQLTIQDDGIGFDSQPRPARRNGKGGLGLLGLRERMNSVGGVLTVKSAPGKGTIIQAQIPLIDRQLGGG
jgi:signal transduction histidine kinase